MGDADLNKDRLELALEAAGLDLWENDLITGEVTLKASKTFVELGFSEEEIASDLQGIYGLFHPDDLDKVKKAVDDHPTTCRAARRNTAASSGCAPRAANGSGTPTMAASWTARAARLASA